MFESEHEDESEWEEGWKKRKLFPPEIATIIASWKRTNNKQGTARELNLTQDQVR